MAVKGIYLDGRQFKPDIVDTTYQITSESVPIYWGSLALRNRRLIVDSPSRGNYSKGEKITVYGRAGDCYVFETGTDISDLVCMTEDSYQLLVKNSIIVSGGVKAPSNPLMLLLLEGVAA